MVKPPTQKQRRIIKAKIQGASNKDIGAAEYPQATPQSQAVLISRELKKTNVAQYMEQSKLQALKEHNITWSRIIRPINDALEANKVVILGKGEDAFADVQPDHTTRLSAAKQARDLMEDKRAAPTDPAPPMNIPADADAIEILRAWKSPPLNS